MLIIHRMEADFYARCFGDILQNAADDGYQGTTERGHPMPPATYEGFKEPSEEEQRKPFEVITGRNLRPSSQTPSDKPKPPSQEENVGDE